MILKFIIFLIIGILTGFIAGILELGKILKEEILTINKKLAEQKLFREILLEWLKLINEGRSIANYFHNNHYTRIAIYGMGDLGICFYAQLKETDIFIDHVVDRNAKNIISDAPAYTPDCDLPEVDVVVITAIQFFDEIKNKISEKYNCPIVSLEDVIYES